MTDVDIELSWGDERLSASDRPIDAVFDPGGPFDAMRPFETDGDTILLTVPARTRVWVLTAGGWRDLMALRGLGCVRPHPEIPRTSAVTRNWSEPALNDFRRNVQGDLTPLAGPDLTIGRGSFATGCTLTMPVIPLGAQVCNRGAEPVDSGMVATFYDGDPREAGAAICSATTVRTLPPGMCEPVSCDWDPAPTEGRQDVWLWVDAADDNVECVETNNIARIASVGCVLM